MIKTVAALMIVNLGVLAGGVHAQTAIEMKPRAEVPGGQAVTLGQVAMVTGQEAARLGAIRVLAPEAVASGTAGSINLDRSAIKALLDAAGVNWAKVTLSGGRTSVLVQASTAHALDAEMRQEEGVPAPQTLTTSPSPETRPTSQIPTHTADTSLASAPTADPTTNAARSSMQPASPSPAVGGQARPGASMDSTAPIEPTGPSVRSLIVDELAREMSIDSERIRLRVDRDEDAKTLQRAVADSWTVDIRVLGSGVTGRTPIRIEAYEGDRVALRATVQATVQVRADVLVAMQTINRGDLLGAMDVEVQERWLTPAQARASAIGSTATPDSLVGSQARRRIEAGRIINPGDVQGQVLVTRGDDVAVRLISGGILLKSRAKAMTSGREGDRITLQMDGRKNTIVGRVDGAGSVIVMVGSSTDETDAAMQ